MAQPLTGNISYNQSLKAHFLLVLLLLLFFCHTAIAKPLSAEVTANPSALSLNTGWKFCPLQSYQPDINFKLLKCHPIAIPGGWEASIPDYNGFGVLYTQFKFQNFPAKAPLGMYISRLRDADKVYINDTLIGETGEFPPHFQKAVLHSRLYFIPTESLNIEGTNQIKIWVFNDARSGGITQQAPVIANYQQLAESFYKNNYQLLFFITVLLVFSLINVIYFWLHRSSKESLYYAAFLLFWCIYLFTFSNLALHTKVSFNLLFRINVASFFAIFILFPLFIYNFFGQKQPRLLTQAFYFISALIPLCFLLPQPGLLYIPLQLVELMAFPVLIVIYQLLYRVIKAELAYAKTMSLVLIVYTLLAITDITLDLIQPANHASLRLHGPWALIILSTVLTIIVTHKNVIYYKDATADKLTGALRKSEFYLRLEQEFFRADRESKQLVVIMLDLDNFKPLNDKHGHIFGDLVLKHLAQSIRAQLRHFDLFCRFGGDEFCIAAGFNSTHEVTGFVDRVHATINQLKIESESDYETIRATFGVSLRLPGETIKSETLVAQADNLLIQAKQQTKGSILWPTTVMPEPLN
ncbi:diguanylate cyclase [Aliikangiella sp. IMCC44653]